MAWKGMLAGSFATTVFFMSQVALGREVPDADGRGSMYGKEAPAFEVRGPYGATYTRERLAGNVIVLQFGTSW